MRTISQIIDFIKFQAGVKSDRQVAILLGMEAPALFNHKKRGTIPYKKITTYCENNGLTLGEALASTDDEESDVGGKTVQGLVGNKEGSKGDLEGETTPIDVFAFAGAGGPVELFEHEPVKTIHIPKHWMKSNMQAVLIRGRSMEPTIMDGAVVGVDTNSKQVVSGELYAIWLEYEGAVVKRLYIERDIVRVCSDNPAFKEMQIKHEEINSDTFILGRMSWLMQSY